MAAPTLPFNFYKEARHAPKHQKKVYDFEVLRVILAQCAKLECVVVPNSGGLNFKLSLLLLIKGGQTSGSSDGKGTLGLAFSGTAAACSNRVLVV